MYQSQATKSEKQKPSFILKPKYIKLFSDELLHIEYINRLYLLYITHDKISIYKGLINGELFQSIDTQQTELNRALYAYSTIEYSDELAKFVALCPRE